MHYMKEKQPQTMFLIPTDEIEISKIISSLKQKK